MADGYTDRFGYPLTAAEALRRQQSPRSSGYYRNGVWIRRKPKAANDNQPAADAKANDLPAAPDHRTPG